MPDRSLPEKGGEKPNLPEINQDTERETKQELPYKLLILDPRGEPDKTDYDFGIEVTEPKLKKKANLIWIIMAQTLLKKLLPPVNKL